MPTDETHKIEDRITAARAKLLATVEGLDAAAWDWRPDDGRWSVRLTLAHVGSAQWSHLEVARRLLAGEPMEIPGFDLDAWSKAHVEERADWPLAQVLSDLDAAQRATLGFLQDLSTEDLALVGNHPALGKVNVGQVLRVIAVHDGMHRRDILSLLREMADEG
jgi:uncharacterized damage-inducible protein DinB